MIINARNGKSNLDVGKSPKIAGYLFKKLDGLNVLFITMTRNII